MSYGMLSFAGRTCTQEGMMNFTHVNNRYRDACHVHVDLVYHLAFCLPQGGHALRKVRRISHM